MAQPSVAAYFNTRKRAAVEQIGRPAKVLLLNESDDTARDTLKGIQPIPVNQLTATISSDLPKDTFEIKRKKVSTKLSFVGVEMTASPKIIKKATPRARIRKNSADVKQQDIQKLFQNMESKKDPQLTEIKEETSSSVLDSSVGQYPTTPTKKSTTIEELNSGNRDVSLAEIKKKLSRSNRLAELKASLAKINKTTAKLDALEKKTSQIQNNAISTLKSFSTIELDVPVSPQKAPISPLKPYLSPTKSVASPKKNLFGSPTKTLPVSSPSKLAAYQRFANLVTEKPSLTLPYKYRFLAEIFRCLDSVCAMFYNRGEIITFKKIKPAIQELLRKNFTEVHLEQIKSIYPDAYQFDQIKIRNFGSTSKHDKYELVLTPKLDSDQHEDNVKERMTSSQLLERRRKLFNLLIEKVKDYHSEFLLSLDLPMNIPREKITRWHPEFDIEKIPDIERSKLPEPPNVEKLSTARDVLSKARDLFSCNTRMEKALQKLSELQQKEGKSDSNSEDKQNDSDVKKETEPGDETTRFTEIKVESTTPKIDTTSILKGIPKSLLEKVRARQAAKALEAMTRAPTKDKEAARYAQLPDLAKYVRNIFISERKSVLPLENLINKLNNSFKTSFTPSQIEDLLKLLQKLLPGWIVFHEIRNGVFVKISKDADMTKVLNKLEKVAQEKANI